MSICTNRSPLLAALLLAGGLALSLSTTVQAVQVFNRTRPGAPAAYGQEQARFIAERLYQAVLGREADRLGLDQATRLIQSGNLSRQVDGMIASPEFRDGTARKSSDDILEQFYRGLHRRSPDPTGIALFIPRLDRRASAGVLMEMLESSEFAETLKREVTETPATRPVSHEAAMACQARVLDMVTDAATGRVLLSFEHAPMADSSERVIAGEAVDRSEAARSVSYRCEGDRASFTYADGRPARGADLRDAVASPVLRSCLAAASEGLRNARVVTAALIGMDGPVTHVFVTGLARNGAVHLNCSMNGERVVSMRGR